LPVLYHDAGRFSRPTSFADPIQLAKIFQSGVDRDCRIVACRSIAGNQNVDDPTSAVSVPDWCWSNAVNGLPEVSPGRRHYVGLVGGVEAVEDRVPLCLRPAPRINCAQEGSFTERAEARYAIACECRCILALDKLSDGVSALKLGCGEVSYARLEH
jgi:hypothetical protein